MTHLSKAHLIGKAAALQIAGFFSQHPRNTHNLMRQESNFQSGQFMEERLEAQLAQTVVYALVPRKRLCVACFNQERCDARKNRVRNQPLLRIEKACRVVLIRQCLGTLEEVAIPSMVISV